MTSPDAAANHWPRRSLPAWVTRDRWGQWLAGASCDQWTWHHRQWEGWCWNGAVLERGRFHRFYCFLFLTPLDQHSLFFKLWTTSLVKWFLICGSLAIVKLQLPACLTTKENPSWITVASTNLPFRLKLRCRPHITIYLQDYRNLTLMFPYKKSCSHRLESDMRFFVIFIILYNLYYSQRETLGLW